MTPRALVERIEALPPDKRAEVEDFIELVARRQAVNTGQPRSSDLLGKINARREAIRSEHGLVDSLPLIRQFRESGGRGTT